MKKILLIIALSVSGFLSDNCKAAVGDHVFFVDITQGIVFGDSSNLLDDEYEINFNIFTDETVTGVEFLTPAGQTFVIPDQDSAWDDVTKTWTCHEYSTDEEAWEWCFERNFTDGSGFDPFGDGAYRFTVTYEGGGTDQTFIWFGVPDSVDPLNQPTQVPQPVFPVPNTSTTSPVTLSWQQSTDQNALGVWTWIENLDTEDEIWVNELLPVSQTSWGPNNLSDGLYQAGVGFVNGYLVEDNGDGVESFVAKFADAEWDFTVGWDWATYEVWGSNTDYTVLDQGWEYYYNFKTMTDFVFLGSSDGQNLEVCDTYQYYLIRTYENVGIDAVRGSDGSYLDFWYAHGNVVNPEYGLNAPDDFKAVVQKDWALVANPGNWTCLTVITDKGALCPTADLTNDCYVDFEDLAVLASQWLTGQKI